MTASNIFSSFLLLLAIHLTGFANNLDWPQFRGPTGQGISHHATPPIQWSPTKNITWKIPLPGQGWSSPIVYGDAIYVTLALVDDQTNPTSLRVLCIDKASGDIRWNQEVLPWQGPSVRQAKNSHASPTPLAHENRIYAHFGHMGTACITTAGKVLWQQQKLYYDPQNGNGGSPVLYQDKLIFHCDAKQDPYVAALYKDTGDIAWRTPRRPTKANKFSHSTPLLIQDQSQTLMISPGSGAVDAYNPNDGTLVWQVRYGKGYSVIPRPVYGHGLVYIGTGYSKPYIYAIRTGGQGDVTDTHIAWQTNNNAPHTPSPLLVGNELYFVSDKGIASCVNAKTGTLYWQEKLNGKFSASPLSAANRIYWVDEKGTTTVTQVGPVFKKLAENSLGQKTLASPALSGRTLYLRTETHLYCIEETSSSFHP